MYFLAILNGYGKFGVPSSPFASEDFLRWVLDRNGFTSK